MLVSHRPYGNTARTAGTMVLLTRLAKIVYRRSTEELLGMRLRHFITLSYLCATTRAPPSSRCARC